MAQHQGTYPEICEMCTTPRNVSLGKANARRPKNEI